LASDSVKNTSRSTVSSNRHAWQSSDR